MPEKKKQHFVPRFYLKYFSNNLSDTHIGLYHFGTKKFIREANLKNQAYEDYFYGKDLKIEDSLGVIEGKASAIIDQIIATKDIPKYRTDEYSDIWLFSLLQAKRTKHSAKETNEMINKTLKTMLGKDERFKDMDDLEFYLNDTPAFNLSILIESIQVAKDLACKLIINKTTQPFITSDHPVVKYNQFLEKRNFPAGREGFATKGLQIFYPISPKLMLIFYDSRVYKIGTKNGRTIETNSVEDINKLNLLQTLNCDELIYFDDTITEYNIYKLAERRERYFLEEKSQINESPEKERADGTISQLYHFYNKGHSTKLELSFVKQTEHAKAYVLTGYAAELRDESLRHRRP